jgi:hypothetical protein
MDAVALIVGALLALLFVGLAVRVPNGGRALIALVFAGGALFNLLVSLPNAEGALHRDVVAIAIEVSAPGFLVLVVAFEVAVAALTAAWGRLATLGLAGAALWSVAMLPVVPPHAWLGSALGMLAVAAAAALLARHRFDASLPAELARRLSGAADRGAAHHA